jgi:hypothetical protein
MKRTLSLILAGSLVAIVIVAATACGSSGAGSTTTSTAPTLTTGSFPTSPAAGAATTAGTGTTIGPTVTTTAATTASTATIASTATTASTAAQEEYKVKMLAWITGPLQELDTSVFDIADASNATSAQIEAVEAFLVKARTALDQLKAVQPSAEAAAPHAQFVKAYEDLLAATDRLVSAMRNKDASQLPAIQEAMQTASGQIQEAKSALSPMIGLAPPTT